MFLERGPKAHRKSISEHCGKVPTAGGSCRGYESVGNRRGKKGILIVEGKLGYVSFLFIVDERLPGLR